LTRAAKGRKSRCAERGNFRRRNRSQNSFADRFLIETETNKRGDAMETHFPDMENTHTRLARERMLSDVRALVRDAEELLHATADDVSDKAAEARAKVTAALDRARATCHELQEQSMASAKAAVKKADATIRDHPYESLGIAFGLGILLGVLLKRK
jgi:ElaB/YqjD/DUF883 family membrane-anchored ribosome-binding protein